MLNRFVLYLEGLYTKNKFEVYISESSEQTNGGVKCDMAVGPCACGAWHSIHPSHTGPARQGPKGCTGPKASIDLKAETRKKPNARKSNKLRSNSKKSRS